MQLLRNFRRAVRRLVRVNARSRPNARCRAQRCRSFAIPLALLRFLEPGLATYRRRRAAPIGRRLIAGVASRRRAGPRPGRRPGARSGAGPIGIKCRAWAASRQASQPDHHPERFVDRFGIAKHARHIRVELDAGAADRCPQALCGSIARWARSRGTIGALVGVGARGVARSRPGCAKLAILRGAGARSAARTGGCIAIFTFKTLHG